MHGAWRNCQTIDPPQTPSIESNPWENYQFDFFDFSAVPLSFSKFSFFIFMHIDLANMLNFDVLKNACKSATIWGGILMIKEYYVGN